MFNSNSNSNYSGFIGIYKNDFSSFQVTKDLPARRQSFPTRRQYSLNNNTSNKFFMNKNSNRKSNLTRLKYSIINQWFE